MLRYVLRLYRDETSDNVWQRARSATGTGTLESVEGGQPWANQRFGEPHTAYPINYHR